MQHIFSVNGQIINILGFSGHTVSAAVTKLHWNSVKKPIDNMEISKCGCVPITVYFQNQETGNILTRGSEFPDPCSGEAVPFWPFDKQSPHESQSKRFKI